MNSGNKSINRKNSGSSIESDEAHATNELEFLAKPIKDDYLAKQMNQWKAHSDAIKYIAVVKETKGCSLFSAGLDNMAKLWSIKGDLLGVLKQGNKFKGSWNFPVLDNLDSGKQEKASEILAKMAKLPKSTERFGSPKVGDKRAGLNKLNTRLIGESSDVLSDKDLIKNLKEVEKLLPKNTLYEELKGGKVLKVRK